MRFRIPFAALVLSLLCSTSNAESADAALSKFLNEVSTYQANFKQVQTDERGMNLVTSSGKMALSRPGKFRWEYVSPAEQLIVTDGKKLWLYDQDLKQVSIRNAEDALVGTPAALLSQRKTLTEAFNIVDEGDTDGVKQLRLVPKSNESDFQNVKLWLRGGAPLRMVFTDTLGGSTDISFQNGAVNNKIASTQFEFVPPRSVEVIDETSTQGEALR